MGHPVVWRYEGLVAAAQSWAVVLVGGLVGIVGVVVAAAWATKSGLVAVLLVVELALVLDGGEAGLDVVELAGGDDVVRLRGHDGRDLVLGPGDAVRSLGMVGEDLGESAGLVLLEGVDLLEELDVGLGVVAGLVHVLETEPVGLALEVAGELEEGDGNGELGSLVDAITC